MSRRRQAAVSLAVAEARLFLRSPVVWGAAVLAAGLGTAWGWTTMPTWPDVTGNAGMAGVVLATGLVVAGHLVASRDHRSGTAAATAVLPTSAPRRTVALLAVGAVAAVVAAAVLVVQLAALLPDRPVGRFDPWSLLGVLVVPVIGAVLGVAVGRWQPATAAGPLTAIVAVAGVLAIPVLGAGDLGWWLFPAPLWQPPLPGMPRASGLHLAYLIAVLVLVVAVVLLRHWRVGPLAVAVLALLAGTGAAVPQRHGLPDDPSQEQVERYTGAAMLHCERHADVRYCALPGFAPWIAEWRRAVEPVAAAVPSGARGDLPTLRQAADGWPPQDVRGAPRTVDPGVRWARHEPWAGTDRRHLATAFATAALVDRPAAQSRPVPCSGAGQARTVVLLWLVAQALPDGAARLAERRINLDPVGYGGQEVDAAAVLLALPRERVTAELGRQWDAVRSPAVGGSALAGLGVPALAGPPAGEASCR